MWVVLLDLFGFLVFVFRGFSMTLDSCDATLFSVVTEQK